MLANSVMIKYNNLTKNFYNTIINMIIIFIFLDIDLIDLTKTSSEESPPQEEKTKKCT
jgi:large-conductance mechanosensitive channel